MAATKKDTLFSTHRVEIEDFSFGEQVAAVFPDMIRRSVPGYDAIIQGIGMITERYAQPHSQLYDLGCSWGAATLAMRRHLQQPDCRLIGVDLSEPMLTRAAAQLAGLKSSVPVELILADISTVPIINASVVVLNFTLQFLAPQVRYTLLEKIYAGLRPQGVLILSEKFLLDDPVMNDNITHLHWDFKRHNGYSELEISQKRTSLENVMRLDSLTAHYDRLHNIGFKAHLWQSAFNFGSFLAIKS